jgi:hypothetical protein
MHVHALSFFLSSSPCTHYFFSVSSHWCLLTSPSSFKLITVCVHVGWRAHPEPKYKYNNGAKLHVLLD